MAKKHKEPIIQPSAISLQPLLNWYHANKREMPWRDHPDSYAVWVSEIMLQQTQVDTVRPYFARFMARFPNIASLANASESDLLKAWEGLGYYTRAHNLQKAAKILVNEHNGALPKTPEALAKLPGIGPYTSAAIASICFGVPAPVVDGNVIRVFARVLAWRDNFKTPAAAAKLRDWLLPHILAAPSAGDFNQARMELGALVCTPTNPACDTCPLASCCLAKRDNTQTNFPVAPPKKNIPTRHGVALLLRNSEDHILLAQRVGKKLLSGLWELPCGETPRPATAVDAKRLLKKLLGLSIPLQRGPLITHTFSHFHQSLRVFSATLPAQPATLPPHFAWAADPAALALTTTTRRALTEHGFSTRGYRKHTG